MDRKLWESIPSVRHAKYPGLHDTYIFGQSSVDGTACIGCQWQTYQILSGADAVRVHDEDCGTVHDCSQWVSCPCGVSRG